MCVVSLHSLPMSMPVLSPPECIMAIEPLVQVPGSGESVNCKNDMLVLKGTWSV